MLQVLNDPCDHVYIQVQDTLGKGPGNPSGRPPEPPGVIAGDVCLGIQSAVEGKLHPVKVGNRHRI